MDLQTATIGELRGELTRLGEDPEELLFFERFALLLADAAGQAKLRALLIEEIELLRSVPQTALTKGRDSGRLGV
jgi:hypothetical protein